MYSQYSLHLLSLTNFFKVPSASKVGAIDHCCRCNLYVAGIVFIVIYTKKKPAHRRTSETAEHQMIDESIVTGLAQQVAESKTPTADEAFLLKLQAMIEQHLGDEDFSVQSLSEMMAMDRTVLYRRMQAVTGLSPSVYIKQIRIDVAKHLLRETDMPVSDIAYKTGFSTVKYFSATFKEAVGVLPGDYRGKK